MTTNRSEEAKAARNAYLRQWRAKNKDKVKAAQDRYWERVAARQCASEVQETAEEETKDEESRIPPHH